MLDVWGDMRLPDVLEVVVVRHRPAALHLGDDALARPEAEEEVRSRPGEYAVLVGQQNFFVEPQVLLEDGRDDLLDGRAAGAMDMGIETDRDRIQQALASSSPRSCAARASTMAMVRTSSPSRRERSKRSYSMATSCSFAAERLRSYSARRTATFEDVGERLQGRVHLDGKPIGDAERTGGSLSFRYDEDYRSDPDATPVSRSMPLTSARPDNRAVRALLDGLLPDSLPARER